MSIGDEFGKGRVSGDQERDVKIGEKYKGALVEMTAFLCSEEVGFQKSDADQCLFLQERKACIIFSLLCVDDSCIFGVKEDIDKVTSKVRKEFTMKTENGLNDFWVVRF